MAELKHKTGDRVKIKSLSWYEKNKNGSNEIYCCNDTNFEFDMAQYCGKETEISQVSECDSYHLKIDNGVYFWTDDMFEDDYHPEEVATEEKISRKNDIKDDKLEWNLLPLLDIEDVVKVFHEGAKKYEPNNWQNLPNGFERYRAAMFRHLIEYMKGRRYDEETGCMHLAQVVWNALAMLHYDKNDKGLFPFKKNDKDE